MFTFKVLAWRKTHHVSVHAKFAPRKVACSVIFNFTVSPYGGLMIARRPFMRFLLPCFGFKSNGKSKVVHCEGVLLDTVKIIDRNSDELHFVFRTL